MDTITVTPPAVGSQVTFRADSPQFKKIPGVVFTVTSEPLPDNTGAEPRMYVWLEVTADAGKAPSRRRTRSAWVDAIEPAVQEASWVLDSDAYVKHGAFNDHSTEWSDLFRTLGGEQCVIEPGWRYGMEPGEMMLMHVVGSPAAHRFVEATVAV